MGTKVEQKEQVGAVESVKAASDVYAPISGEVVEANEALESEPSLINSSPFEKGAPHIKTVSSVSVIA